MRRKKEQMYSLVKRWQAGTASKTDFCKSEQINIHTFTYWVKKYNLFTEEEKPKSKSEKFISLRVTAPKRLDQQGLELYYPNGLRLRLEGQPDLAYLESLIRIKI